MPLLAAFVPSQAVRARMFLQILQGVLAAFQVSFKTFSSAGLRFVVPRSLSGAFLSRLGHSYPILGAVIVNSGHILQVKRGKESWYCVT